MKNTLGGGNASRTPTPILKIKKCVYRYDLGKCALAGRHGRAHRHRPYQTPSYFSTQSHTNKIPSMCNPPLPISTKPHGAPLPHQGYTFDSAGLASATQPTLGNNASEEATPLGVVLFPSHCFFMPSHTTLGGGNASRTPTPIL